MNKNMRVIKSLMFGWMEFTWVKKWVDSTGRNCIDQTEYLYVKKV